MNAKQLIVSVAALSAFLSVVDSTDAYTISAKKWSSNSMTMNVHIASFPANSALRSSLNIVERRFAMNPSQFWIQHNWNYTSTPSLTNTVSEVWFASRSVVGAPAKTTITWTTADNVIVRADVVFANDEPYTTSMNKTSLWPYGGTGRPFETTALHEYGHVAGLGHEADEYNIMGQDWTHIQCNGQNARSYLGADASAGLMALYGRDSTASIEDVSATVFRYAAADGEYSTHRMCDVKTITGTVMTGPLFNGQPRYSVNKGSSYQFEYTLENSGELARSVQVRFYLSSDSIIQTTDRLLYTVSSLVPIGLSNVKEFEAPLLIPANLVSGSTHYVGVIVDSNNALLEVEENNNAAYHIIRVN